MVQNREVLTDISREKLAFQKALLEAEGFEVQVTDQGSNLFTLVATIEDVDARDGNDVAGPSAAGVQEVVGEPTASEDGDASTLTGDLVQMLRQQIAIRKIIFDSAGLQDELLGLNGGINVTKKLQRLVLILSELTPSVIRISSMIRADRDSHHGSGRAVDIGNEEIAAELLPVVATDAKVAELGIDELIFDAALAGHHQDRNKWNYDQGKKHSFNTTTLDAHGNHIHFAVTA